MPVEPISPARPIAEKLIKTFPISLDDGTKWSIIITINTLCEFEKMTGKDILFGSLTFQDSITNLRTLLYLCLREQGAQYSLEEVGKLATGHWTLIQVTMISAYKSAMVQEEDAMQIELLMGELKAAS